LSRVEATGERKKGGKSIIFQGGRGKMTKWIWGRKKKRRGPRPCCRRWGKKRRGAGPLWACPGEWQGAALQARREKGEGEKAIRWYIKKGEKRGVP